MSNLSDSESGSTSSFTISKENRKKKAAFKDQDGAKADESNSQTDLNTTVINEPELVNIYINKLLPIFCNTYQNSMIHQVKKSSLSLIRKIISYMNREQLIELNKTSICSQIVEVISNCLDTEEEETTLFALQMIQDLLDKEFNLFLDHFARLGVFNKVQSIAGINELNNNNKELNNDVNKSIYSNKTDFDQLDSSNETNDSVQFSDECKEMQIARPYHWRDWNIVRSKDCLYLWSDCVILELSLGSNGWFRFILDGKLATMYSSGSPERSPESGTENGGSEDRNELYEKLHRARSQVRSSMNSQCILTSNSNTTHTIGNWTLSSKKDGELIINNIEGTAQCTILKEDVNGFVFESNRGTKHAFTAETTLGNDFNNGWPSRKGKKRFKSKIEALKEKIKNLAKDIYESYFHSAQQQPRSTVAKLNSIISSIEESLNMQLKREPEWKNKLKNALFELLQLLNVEHSISSYELYTSGLIQILIKLLKTESNKRMHIYDLNNIDSLRKERIEIFKQMFNLKTMSKALIRKLISVLESIEKLPVYFYETPGSASYSLQILTKKLRFKLERTKGQNTLIDRTGRCMKTEPLATINQLEKYLLKMVSKQWYDYDRSTFNFVKKLKDKNSKLEFTYQYDFDENGIMYWIGTNGKKCSEWVNPATANLVYITSNEQNLPFGRLKDILSRDVNAINCHTNDNKKAWFTIDLGLWIIPTAYTLRHSRGYEKSALRTWLFQVSKDGEQWLTLYNHKVNS